MDRAVTAGRREPGDDTTGTGMATGRLPYFDDVFAALAHSHSEVLEQLIANMHWGVLGPDDPVDSVESQIAGTHRLTERVCVLAGVRDGCRVLDVGCGFGGTLRHISQRVSGATLVGLNIDRRQLGYIQAQVQPELGNRIHLILAEGSCIGLRSGGFDAVLAIESLFHLDSRARFFREARRLLTEGGRLVITDFLVADSVRLGDLPTLDRRMRSDLTRFFGRAPSGHVSLRRYQRHAAAVGLHLTTNENLSRQILPSLEGLGRLYEMISGEASVRALEALHDLTARGFLEYRILGFSRVSRH